MERLSLRARLLDASAPLVVCIACFALSATEIGGLPDAFLRAPAGAAGLAMGNAQSARAEYLAPWWNPASLSPGKGRAITAGSGIKTLGRIEGLAGWEFPIPPRMAMGLLLLYRGDPSIDGFDAQMNPLDPSSYTTATVKVGFGYQASRRMAWGINSSIFYQRIAAAYDQERPLYSSASSLGGVDIGCVYQASTALRLAAVVRNLFATSEWEISSSFDLGTRIIDHYPVVMVAASAFSTSFSGYPLIWTNDLKGYIFLSDFTRGNRPAAVLCTGAEWQRWKTFYLRAGVGDLALDGTLTERNQESALPLRMTAGFFADLSHYFSGLALNYGIALHNAWAGPDQQIDVVFTF